MIAPTVSVVIPAFNAAWCVDRAIGSVLAQQFTDIEVIVVDDGSTDETTKVAAAHGARLRILSKENGGLASARNFGIGAARGKYVAFLDADDWWLPDKLVRQLAWLEAHPEAVFCSTAARVVNPGGETIGEWRCGNDTCGALAAIFAINAYVAGSGSAVVAHRKALDQAGGFDEKLRSLEDIDMWMRLAARGGYHCIDDLLTVILKRPDSMSGNLDVMRESAITVMRKNRHLLPARRQGAFWRQAYAGMLADYAKWEHRDGRTGQAVRHLAQAIMTSPIGRGRLALGLLAAIATGQRF